MKLRGKQPSWRLDDLLSAVEVCTGALLRATESKRAKGEEPVEKPRSPAAPHIDEQ